MRFKLVQENFQSMTDIVCFVFALTRCTDKESTVDSLLENKYQYTSVVCRHINQFLSVTTTIIIIINITSNSLVMFVSNVNHISCLCKFVYHIATS